MFKKKSWPGLNGSWAEPDVRDEVIDYIRTWSDKTQIKVMQMVQWIGIGRSKYYQWRDRYGQVNEHNRWMPRDSVADDYGKTGDHRLLSSPSAGRISSADVYDDG